MCYIAYFLILSFCPTLCIFICLSVLYDTLIVYLVFITIFVSFVNLSNGLFVCLSLFQSMRRRRLPLLFSSSYLPTARRCTSPCFSQDTVLKGNSSLQQHGIIKIILFLCQLIFTLKCLLENISYGTSDLFLIRQLLSM